MELEWLAQLADLKESNPIELAEYAIANGLEKEPAFAWWIPFTLKKRERIVAAVNSRYNLASLKGVIVDIHMLSQSDYLVCTFSSQVCRIAYEIQQQR